MRSLRGLLFSISFASALSGCGGAALESGVETTAAPAAREPLTELDALQRAFDVSEAQVGAQLEQRQAEPPLAPPKKAEGASPRDEPAATDDAPVGSACDSVCRALGSMRRSADGICSLTSEPHERCTGARARVEAAAQKVAAAGCLCRL
jgi:hypothetical protein